jgi:DNA-binding response OmpR family regulator
MMPANRYGATMPLVLLVEDDITVRGALTHALIEAGHAVRPVGTAAQALRDVAAHQPDLVILDLGLPDIDGSDALRMLRAVCDAPVIIATARRSEAESIRLLNAGADDYVMKPFSPDQLNARINAVLRRTRAVDPAVLAEPVRVGGLCLDPAQRSATLDGEPLRLTRKEYDLLAYLAARVGRVVTRRELVTEVWRQPYVGTDKTLDVHLSWLRRKLGETAASSRYLQTVRGVGVMLVVPR